MTRPIVLDDGNALIGHTGFVGGNLARQTPFDARFNSKNIDAIRGQTFRHIVCAGVSAVKWWANKNPVEDWERIERLIASLRKVEAAHFTLISTVDVYPDPVGVDETTRPEIAGLHAYGANRLILERFVEARFPRHTIARLPALVGPGLKKNAMYDLIHDNQIELIHPRSSFQWYPLDRLAVDLIQAEKSDLQVINFATEPVTMREIRDQLFPGKEIGLAAPCAVNYDIRTRAAPNGYMLDKAQVMAALAAFVRAPQ